MKFSIFQMVVSVLKGTNMNKELLEILQSYNYLSEKVVWEEGMVRKNSSGHTREVAELETVHSGRDTSLAYVFGKIIGNIDETEGIQILQSISKLQVTDKKSDRYGAFRWYAEESKPIDTNAAFFTMAPLAILLLYSPEKLSRNAASFSSAFILPNRNKSS